MATCVDVLFGGKSPEHSISIISARAIVKALCNDLTEFTTRIVFINPSGHWFFSDNVSLLLDHEVINESLMTEVLPSVVPGKSYYAALELIAPKDGMCVYPDVVLPVLHGPNGEDGKIQALFELANIPCAGCGVMAGAITMDKEIMKQLFKAASLPVIPYESFTVSEWEFETHSGFSRVGKLKLPFYVKPCGMGSSIGITKVEDMKLLSAAVSLAFEYDRKIIIEEGKLVREVEIAMMGDFDDPEFSDIGEIITVDKDFYNFEKKYKSHETRLGIPAELSQEDQRLIRQYALSATRLFNLKGLSRIDFFKCREGGTIWINEINAFPGFTSGSMFPALWKSAGFSFAVLIRKILLNAIKKTV